MDSELRHDILYGGRRVPGFSECGDLHSGWHDFDKNVLVDSSYGHHTVSRAQRYLDGLDF